MTFLEIMCLKKKSGKLGSKKQDKNVGEKNKRLFNETRKPVL